MRTCIHGDFFVGGRKDCEGVTNNSAKKQSKVRDCRIRQNGGKGW
jgi:hypothetical protein